MEFRNLEKNNRLGQGLESLLGPSSKSHNKVLALDIDKIVPAKSQPRRRFEKASLEELALSVKKHGVLQPILVKARGENYEIIAGERRWRAAGQAGLHKIPAILKTPERGEDRFWSLLENLQREDLNPIETATAYSDLLKTHKLSQQELAETMGKPRSSLVNTLRLLNLPPEVQKSVAEGRISPGQAKEILRAKSPAEQKALADRCLQGKWTVRDLQKTFKPPAAPFPSWAKGLVPQLEKLFSRRVRLSLKDGKGRLTFYFKSEGELKKFTERLCRKNSSI